MKTDKQKIGLSYLPGNNIELLLDGPQYQKAFLDAINTAQHLIHLQVYIFSIDQFGQQVIDGLLASRKRGVLVFILVDAIGSSSFSNTVEKQMTDAGIIFIRFNLLKFIYFSHWGRRLHHKILLIDDKLAIMGGINIHDPYDKEHPGIPRLDFSVKVFGPVIQDIAWYCQKIFAKAGGLGLSFIPIKKVLLYPENMGAQMVVNDWLYGRWQISREYSTLTRRAKKSIIILNSYFFPRRKFIKQLIKAKQRGVDVKLILPRHSDWHSWVVASQYLYQQLLKGEIEIWEWTQSILHGKLAIVDDSWCTIGSFNLNYTSYQGNLEMNLNIHSLAFTQELTHLVDQLIKEGCVQIKAQDFLNKSSIFIRIKRFIYYLILSLTANLSISLINLDPLTGKFMPVRDKSPRRWQWALVFFILLLVSLVYFRFQI